MTVFSHLSNAEFVDIHELTLDDAGRHGEIVSEAIRRLREIANKADVVNELEDFAGDAQPLVDLFREYYVDGIGEIEEALEMREQLARRGIENVAELKETLRSIKEQNQ